MTSFLTINAINHLNLIFYGDTCLHCKRSNKAATLCFELLLVDVLSWNGKFPCPQRCVEIHLLARPLHLPVVRAPCQGLSTEKLSPEVEAVWVVWWVQVLNPHCGLMISIWQLHVAKHCVGVHGGFKANWRERIHFSEDSGQLWHWSEYIVFNILEYIALTFQKFFSSLWFWIHKSHCC